MQPPKKVQSTGAVTSSPSPAPPPSSSTAPPAWSSSAWTARSPCTAASRGQCRPQQGWAAVHSGGGAGARGGFRTCHPPTPPTPPPGAGQTVNTLKYETPGETCRPRQRRAGQHSTIPPLATALNLSANLLLELQKDTRPCIQGRHAYMRRGDKRTHAARGSVTWTLERTRTSEYRVSLQKIGEWLIIFLGGVSCFLFLPLTLQRFPPPCQIEHESRLHQWRSHWSSLWWFITA